MKQLIIQGLATVLLTGGALAHGTEEHSDAKSEPAEMIETEFGKTGEIDAVNQTVTVVMSDEMTFTPDRFKVGVGDTVRFKVKNDGEVLHEMVLGRAEDLKKHAEMMIKFPEMEHEEPYMTHVKPGKNGEIVWTFSRAGTFEFGCLIPGHYDAGMKGTIVVQ